MTHLRTTALVALGLLWGAPALAGGGSGGGDPMIWPGSAEEATPLPFKTHFKSLARYDDLGAIQLDDTGLLHAQDGALTTRFHVGASYETDLIGGWFKAALEYEQDFMDGIVHGGSDNATDGLFLPGTEGHAKSHLRRAFAKAHLAYVATLAGGVSMSHWGLGLLANDGDHGWTPGSAQVGAPTRGDNVLRALFATGPWPQAANLLLFGAYDKILEDDVQLDGDETEQIVGGLMVGGRELPWVAGLYGVYRMTEAEDGDTSTAIVVDGYGKYQMAVGDGMAFTVAAEVAGIFGETDLLATPSHETHQLTQVGAIVRAELAAGNYGGVLDLLYASGDQNFDDDTVHAFRVDRNFEMGMLLFRQVIAAQSARTPIRASDPDLVGEPADDLDRIPTRGNITNTIAFFPRLWYRPTAGIELYGGGLVAMAAVPYADPYQTRLNGGELRNSFNAPADIYYGTEFDLGARMTGLLWGMEVGLGIEGAVFVPGNAFDDADGGSMDPIYGMRGTVTHAF